MASRDAIAQELARFLSEVPSGAREKLYQRIESDRLNGEVRPEYALILSALNALPEGTARLQVAPGTTPKELFFEPVKPFVSKWPDGEKKQRGRIPETALAPIWEWLCRDVASNEIGRHEKQAKRALRNGDVDRAYSEMETARQKVGSVVQALLKQISSDQDEWRRTSNHIGGVTMLDHVSEIREIFLARPVLDKMAKRLPAQLNGNDADQIANAVEIVSAATGGGVALDLSLVFLTARFSDPARALRLGVEALGGDSAETLAQGPYAILGDLVLFELEHIVHDVSKNINRVAIDETVRGNIEAFAVMSRRFAADIDLSKPNPWSRRLTAARARISDLLGPQLDLLSRCLRRALAPASELPLKALPDASECEDALGRLDLLVMLSGHAEELALKDRITQVRGRTESYVEAANAAITNAIRQSAGEAQAYANAYLDFAVKVNERLHGEEFARILRRLGQAARPKSNGETDADTRPRKSA